MINVRDFIQKNYKEFKSEPNFLIKEPTQRTKNLMEKVNNLLKQEIDNGGVLDIDTETITSLLTYPAGYIDKENELIVGLQTDAPLKRGINPFGGIKMARQACQAYGYKLSDKIEENFKYKTTHNDGVFRMYTEEMRRARHCHVLTGLPDGYGRGRIIGDYRRVALYGIAKLIEEKRNDISTIDKDLQLIEEVHKQISFLEKLLDMAKLYGYDISQPATNAKEAIQWTYFAYLGAIKEQNGAAMSLGRVSTFFDIYIEKDIQEGLLTEEEAQELIDDFVIKLRLARHLRTPEYNKLFAGDPLWITEAVGGMGEDGRTLVTKTSYRMLNTLNTLGPAPEPNLTVLWSKNLPIYFKNFCTELSIKTSSIQYENDDLMRPIYGDDYAIACCVSAMKIGKQMQYFGARCNLPKLLLIALNGGYDVDTKTHLGPQLSPLNSEILSYDIVKKRLDVYMSWLAKLYVETMNIIHYNHDKYCYEKTQMALHDTEVHRFMAFGIAGLSIITDSLSAIKYSEVRPIFDDNGYIYDFVTKNDYPAFGNDDDRVDSIAQEIVHQFITELRKTPAHRNAEHTLSVLTITSNIVYGENTGATPDGRLKNMPFAPGANPMPRREKNGALASLNSVAKLDYNDCRDGISNTFSLVPLTLGKELEIQKKNLSSILDGYFANNAHHLNVNILNRETLMAAYESPELYPNLTIRVSGYAVNFIKLTKQQQLEVINRTFHEQM